MSDLSKFVEKHVSVKGSVEKNQWDVVELVEQTNAVNMYFFDVSLVNNPTVEDFIRLTNEHKAAFANATPLDGAEHGYIELGGWIGDQGVALMYMALGEMLGLWKVMHPGHILDITNPEDKKLADLMAGNGMISILGKTS